jgi:hypothetical protein
MLKHSDAGMSLGGFIKMLIFTDSYNRELSQVITQRNQQWHFAKFTLGTYLFTKSTLQNCKGQIAILLIYKPIL